MTPAEVLAAFATRGVEFRRHRRSIAGKGPAGELTSADWDVLRVHKHDLLTLLRPIPSLADVYAGLTDVERERLRTEGDAGDTLAQLVLRTLAEGPG